jgi:hypothetical protein
LPNEEQLFARRREKMGAYYTPAPSSPINLPTMADLDNKNNELAILNLVDNPVITHAHPVKLCFSLQFNAIIWTRICFQQVQSFAQSLIKFLVRQHAQELFRWGG